MDTQAWYKTSRLFRLKYVDSYHMIFRQALLFYLIALPLLGHSKQISKFTQINWIAVRVKVISDLDMSLKQGEQLDMFFLRKQ